MDDFYSMPFNFKQLLHQEKRDLYCDLEESIQQYITLIITTKFGEFAYDTTFGCQVWEVDFIVPANLNTWKDQIKESLQEAISKHEKRIDSILYFDVRVNETTIGKRRVNQQLDIQIKGTVKGTNKEFHYSETLFFSPYSLF